MISKKSPIIIIEEAYKEHYLYLYRLLLKLNSTPQVVEDIIQGVFLKLISNPELIKDVANLRAWLITCAKNKLIDIYRENKTIIIDDEQLIENFILASYRIDTIVENRIMINLTLQKLSLKDKAIIIARDYMGYTYEEIAALLNISYSNVKSRLFRARKQFLKYYEEVNNND